jgi:hypothetical protein
MSHSRHSANDRQNWAPMPAPHQPATQYPPAAGYPQEPARFDDDTRQVPAYSHSAQRPARGRVSLSAAASFWYILGCIAFGAMYLAKVPAKKALSEAGMAEMTAAEKFWYVLECIPFGGGYFAKLPVKKALSEAWLG